MNLKSRLVGFGAALLALGMIAGVMAAPGDVTVTAVASPTLCSAAFTSGTYNLGSWTWTGSAYALNSGSTSVGTGAVTVTPGHPGQGGGNNINNIIPCNVTLTLTAPTGAGGTIPATSFKAEVVTGAALTGTRTSLSSTAIGASQITTASGTINVGLELASFPSTLPAGTYNGAIVVAATNAA